MAHSRVSLHEAFARARQAQRAALITYTTAGYPDPAAMLDLVAAMQDGGSDIIELGIPFSDPVADGPVIQRADEVALRAGVTPRLCLDMAGQLRARGVTVPLVFLTYYNPVLRYGLEAFARDAAAVGMDGLIVPDLPPEEAMALQRSLDVHGLALILLVAPTTAEARLAQIAAATQGFLYVVSRLGTTGTDLRPGDGPLQLLALARRHARTPIAVGFGISQPEQVRTLAGHADGIIVGSGVVQRATEGAGAVRAYVASLRKEVSWR